MSQAGPQHTRQRKLPALEVDEAHCSSSRWLPALWGAPALLRSRYGHAWVTQELPEALVCGVGRSFCSPAPVASQIPSRRLPALLQQHPAGCRLSPAKSLLHAASRQSVPTEGAMCCPDLFLLPGASVDSCRMRSKSESLFLCH